MRAITANVHQLERSMGANAYLLDLGDRSAVVDPGLPFGAKAVVSELCDHARLESVTDILLTHYDFDHAGAATYVAQQTGAVIWIAAPDAAVLAGEAGAPTVVRSLMNIFGKAKLPTNVKFIDTQRNSWVIEGVRAIPTPGHTAGHSAFMFDECVMVGDAARVNNDGTLRDFPSVLVSDMARARRSINELEGLRGDWWLPGHGQVARRATEGAA